LELPVVTDKSCRAVAGVGNRPSIAVAAGSYSSTSKLDADGSSTGDRIIGSLIKPYEIRHPVSVRVTCEESSVRDLVGVQVVKSAVAVCRVALTR
jgi:hypothetical protein